MVAVPVGYENVGETVSAALDPIADGVNLVDSQGRVDEYGVVLAVDERDRQRRKHAPVTVRDQLSHILRDRVGDERRSRAFRIWASWSFSNELSPTSPNSII